MGAQSLRNLSEMIGVVRCPSIPVLDTKGGSSQRKRTRRWGRTDRTGQDTRASLAKAQTELDEASGSSDFSLSSHKSGCPDTHTDTASYRDCCPRTSWVPFQCRRRCQLLNMSAIVFQLTSHFPTSTFPEVLPTAKPRLRPPSHSPRHRIGAM